MEESDELDQNIFNCAYEDPKAELRKFILQRVKEKYNLKELKRSVEENWNKTLDILEVDYIERKFVKYCSNLWLDDIFLLLSDAIKSKKDEDFLVSIDSVRYIKDVPKDLQISDYYKLLCANSKLMNEVFEKTLIWKIRNLYLELTLKYNAIATQELEFINTFSSYLDNCKNIQHIISKLDLLNFINDKSSFHSLLASISDLDNNADVNISPLKEIAKNLQREKDYTLLKKTKKSIADIIKPAEVLEKNVDDRCIVEIKCRNLKISDILNNVESLLKSNNEISEVQFIIINNLYIDKHLNNEIWHGQNISVLAKNIIVMESVTWNVNGITSQHKYETDAGTNDDGSGKDGSDGYPGESGGNVLILAKNITNSEHLLICSNGGNGSDGQNGGNGVHGAHGQGISRTDFMNKFPSIIKFACNTYDRREKVKEMIKYIKDLSSSIQCEWYTDSYDPGEYDVFLEVTTSQGNQITFSYCRGGFSRRFQGFLLYKGSLGQPGKPGGRNGLGGQGGYAGSIEVNSLMSENKFQVQTNMNNGDDGKPGRAGEHGDHGKNTWDMGYMDYQFWGETVVYDSCDNNISIDYYSENNSNRVWCPYKEYHCNSEYTFAEMEVKKIRHIQKTTYNEKKLAKENKDRQHHSQATKKKNVLKTNLYNYTHVIELEERSKSQNVQFQLQEADLRASQAFSVNEIQEQKVSKGLKINRISSYDYIANNKRTDKLYKNLKVKKPIVESENFEALLNVFIHLPKKRCSINKWLQIKNHNPNLHNLNLLYTIWEKFVKKIKNRNDDVEHVELIFVEKYRTAVLQEIDQKVKEFEENLKNYNTNDNGISAIEAVKYLDVDKKKYSDFYHNELRSIRQYIFDNEEQHRENVVNFCTKHFLETHKKELGETFAKFYLDLLDTKVDENIKTYFDSYAIYLKNKNEKIMTHYSIFKKELSKSRHKNVLELMLTNTIDKYLSNEVKTVIEKDPFLKILYERLNSQFQSTHDWSKCLQDIKFMNFFFNYIKQNGSKCKCYRELIAHIFEINIRVYCVINDEELRLLDNHNSSSSNVINLICKDMILTEIDIDAEYFQLYKKNKCLDNIYFNSLSDIYSLNRKKDLVEYLKNYTIKQFKQSMYSENIFKETINEEKDIENIALFFPNIENKQIKAKLQNIRSNYIGHSGIIRILLRRFNSEGRKVSSNEVGYLINQILDSCIKDAKQENRICWIVATAFQNDWIAEILLIQLESFFMKCLDKKDLYRKYLTGLDTNILVMLGIKLLEYEPGDEALSLSYVEETLYLLSNICEININLDDIDLCEWLYIIKEYYWINKLEKSFNLKQNQLDSIPYYILSLENMFGMDVVNEFLDVLAQFELSENDINTFKKILEHFHDERWNLGYEELDYLRHVNNLLEWIEHLDVKFYASDTERSATQLLKLIQGNSNTSLNILNTMPDILETLRIINDKNYSIDGKSIKSFSENDIKKWTSSLKNDNNMLKKIFSNHINATVTDILKDFRIKKLQEQIFALIDRAIELKRGFQLRDTQKLTIMSLLYNNSSTLAQVSTGEGKSLIVVAVSIIKALCGEKVDIVTSSSVLAIRDAECNKDIYDLFNIRVSHNCSEKIEKRKESYSTCTVIYGDLSNFQRDYLIDRFYGQNILGDHDFSNIIIDEVDSMLLDKGNNMLYLSHDIAGLDKLESVYVYIWSTISTLFYNITELDDATYVKKVKEAILSDLYRIVKRNEIDKLDVKLNSIQKTEIWNFLRIAKVLNGDGRLLIDDVSKINYLELPKEYIHLKDHIEYLLRECIERQRYIYVPEYLKPFIERHLESWIYSAIGAFLMKVGQDYVVDVDRTKTISDGNPIITIIDRDTGTDQLSSQWDEALHQFLQLKHGCKLTMQSLKAVFISNVSFFKLYRKLYGLTGTLGSQRERDLLKEVHNVDFVTVPTAKSKKFHEIEPIVCKNKESWIDSIHDSIKTIVDKENRSILIICQLVDDVQFLQKALTKRGIKNIHTYTRDYEEFEIAQGSKKLEEGQIIISTNLAGRGTDIVLTHQLKERGGMHVILTYLPSNIRIERQAFGRAARCGDKGTGRLIIEDSSYQGGVTSKVLNLKKDRDTEELNRISKITSHYNNKIKIEENCFNEFKTLYERMKNHFKIKKTPEDLQSILLQCCLDKWAFWLDEKSQKNQSKNIINKSIFYDQFQKLLDQLEKIFNDLPSGDEELSAQICYNWAKESPTKMVVLGKYFLKENKHNEALYLFNAVIQKEGNFSETAHYYKAFVLSKQIDWSDLSKYKEMRKCFKSELYEAVRLFKAHSDRALYNGILIDNLKEKNSKSIIHIKAYMQQQQTFSNFYNMLIKSIDDILGSPVSSHAFISVYADEILAEDVYEALVADGILTEPKIKNKIQELELKSISQDFGISSKELFNFLNKHKGEPINESFLKTLKEEINLPTCDHFWKILTKQGILFNEIKFVIIDKEKLKKLDPSFLEFLHLKISRSEIRTLEKDKMSPNDKKDAKNNETDINIFINGQCISEQKNDNSLILYKDELVTLDRLKFSFLKRKGILSFNKMASIDKNKIRTVKFDNFDSIVANDFNKINISTKQAEEILAELVREEVLETQVLDNNQNIYKLKANYEKITQIKLESRQIYKNGVIALLFTCFAYRIAIENLEKQITDNKPPFRIQLMTKPHHQLLFELFEKRIFKHAKISSVEPKSIEDRVKKIFSNQMSKKQFLEILVKSKLILNENANDLFNELLKIGWIKQDTYFGYSDKIKITDDFNNKVELPSDSPFKTIQKSLQLFLKYRCRLGNEKTIKNLAKTLIQLKSSIKPLSVPDNNLKQASDYFGASKFHNVDEIHIMSLNGLDHVQVFKEHTGNWQLYTFCVFGLGFLQLALGVCIAHLSMGLMTHFGSMLICEGINDMLYAINAYKTGYFNWKDYTQHKVKSIIFTAISACLFALASKCFSSFGQKMLGRIMEHRFGKEGSTFIIQNVRTVKGMALAKGLGMCITNHRLELICRRYLSNFSENVRLEILSNINEGVDDSEFLKILEIVYKIHGENKAKKAIFELTDNFFEKNNIDKQLLPIAIKLSSSIEKEISEAIPGEQFTIENICKFLVWSNEHRDRSMIKKTTTEQLDNLCEEINKKMINIEDRSEMTSKGEPFVQDKYDKFKSEVTDYLKSTLRKQAEQIIEQHVVRPIAEESYHKLMRLCAKQVKVICRYVKENDLETQHEKLKEQFKKDVNDASKNLNQDSTTTVEKITKKYHENLLKLLEKSRNPALFAAIIRENVPMDLTCCMAAGPVIEAVLKDRGIVVPGLTIVIYGEGGISQQILLGPKSKEKQVIQIELKNNHYQLVGCDNISDSSESTGINDCLYQALSSVIPGLGKIGSEIFRNEMANCIEQNPVIQNYIINGWHRHLISLRLFGGFKKKPMRKKPTRKKPPKREKSKPVIDPESNEQEDNKIRKKKGSKKDVDQHIVDRFLRLVRLIGMIQRISEQINEPRETIIEGARSHFQDGHSGMGNEYHASHVVRAAMGEFLKKLLESNLDEDVKIYEEMKNFLGHTQIVPRRANEWHGLGGIIDRFQEDVLQNLLSHNVHDIDFSCEYDLNAEIIINSIRSEYIRRIEDFLDNNYFELESDRDFRDLIEKALEIMEEMSSERIYEAGKDGYTGKYKDDYL